jgi:hypothetical protein
MRILGFSKKWDKLSLSSFTTFRVPRKDKDWQLGEQVQIVYKPRSEQRNLLGMAEIIGKEPKTFIGVTETEAMQDGFLSCLYMWLWLRKAHKGITMTDTINKLTLRWLNDTTRHQKGTEDL